MYVYAPCEVRRVKTTRNEKRQRHAGRSADSMCSEKKKGGGEGEEVKVQYRVKRLSRQRRG
jgi:hypothetical protein